MAFWKYTCEISSTLQYFQWIKGPDEILFFLCNFSANSVGKSAEFRTKHHSIIQFLSQSSCGHRSCASLETGLNYPCRTPRSSLPPSSSSSSLWLLSIVHHSLLQTFLSSLHLHYVFTAHQTCVYAHPVRDWPRFLSRGLVSHSSERLIYRCRSILSWRHMGFWAATKLPILQMTVIDREQRD